MVCLGFKPGAAGWKARTNPLRYGGTPFWVNLCRLFVLREKYLFSCVPSAALKYTGNGPGHLKFIDICKKTQLWRLHQMKTKKKRLEMAHCN